MESCTIQWMPDDCPAPPGLFRLAISQSPRFGAFDAAMVGGVSRTGLIVIGGKTVGMARVTERRALGGLIHDVMFDRGPVWIEGRGGPGDHAHFWPAFRAAFPKRAGRRFRLVPEIEDSIAARRIIADASFHRLDRQAYQTIWLDLQRDDQTIRSQLRADWRGRLNKAMRQQDLAIIWDDPLRFLPLFIKQYQLDKTRKAYPGASPAYLDRLARHFAASGDLLIGRALSGGQAVSAMLILKHEASATYQAGWTLPSGREMAAHHRLMWESFALLRGAGLVQFDLGGLNDQGAKAVGDFKRRIGGDLQRLVGQYS